MWSVGSCFHRAHTQSMNCSRARRSSVLSWAHQSWNRGVPPSMVTAPNRYSSPFSAKGKPSMSKKTSPFEGGGSRASPRRGSSGTAGRSSQQG